MSTPHHGQYVLTSPQSEGMVGLLGDVKLALPNKVAILDKLRNVSTFLDKVMNVAADNAELATTIAEVSSRNASQKEKRSYRRAQISSVAKAVVGVVTSVIKVSRSYVLYSRCISHPCVTRNCRNSETVIGRLLSSWKQSPIGFLSRILFRAICRMRM